MTSVLRPGHFQINPLLAGIVVLWYKGFLYFGEHCNIMMRITYCFQCLSSYIYDVKHNRNVYWLVFFTFFSICCRSMQHSRFYWSRTIMLSQLVIVSNMWLKVALFVYIVYCVYKLNKHIFLHCLWLLHLIVCFV